MLPLIKKLEVSIVCNGNFDTDSEKVDFKQPLFLALVPNCMFSLENSVQARHSHKTGWIS